MDSGGLCLTFADRLNSGANDLGHEGRRVEHESQQNGGEFRTHS
jgi:hypothetical protein